MWTISTNRDPRGALYRSAFFGPVGWLLNPGAKWSSLIPAQVNEQSCEIRGLIVDLLNTADSHLTTIGVHTIPNEKPTTDKTNPPQPFAIPAFRSDPPLLVSNRYLLVCQTTAELSSVKRLAIQKTCGIDFDDLARPRCSGLCIHHNDGSIETLGQWDGSSTADSMVIFDADVDGSLEALTLRYRRGLGSKWDDDPPTQHYITDIRVRASQRADVEEDQGEGPHQPVFHWQASEEKNFIAWWFTPLFDQVAQWDYTMLKFDPSRQSKCEIQRVE